MADKPVRIDTIDPHDNLAEFNLQLIAQNKNLRDMLADALEDKEELEAIIDLRNKREYYNKFVKEIYQKEYAKKLCHPDFDFIYQLYFEQREMLRKYEEVVGKLVIRGDEVVGVLKGRETTYIPHDLAKVFRTMAVRSALHDLQDKIHDYYSHEKYQPTAKSPVKHTDVQYMLHVIDKLVDETIANSAERNNKKPDFTGHDGSHDYD